MNCLSAIFSCSRTTERACAFEVTNDAPTPECLNSCNTEAGIQNGKDAAFCVVVALPFGLCVGAACAPAQAANPLCLAGLSLEALYLVISCGAIGYEACKTPPVKTEFELNRLN